MKPLTPLMKLIVLGIVACIASMGPLIYKVRKPDFRLIEMLILSAILIGNAVYLSHTIGSNPNRRLLFGILWVGLILYAMFFESVLNPQLLLFVVSGILTVISITVFLRKRHHQVSDPKA